MQVLEAIFLEIWRLCFLIFIERELIYTTRLCSFQLYSKRTQLPICITLLTTLLFIFFTDSLSCLLQLSSRTLELQGLF